MTFVPIVDRPLKKGEKTRNQIKQAVLEVVAEGGVSAVTHRSVAAKAGVSLSATTYHFKNLDDMMVQAFGLIDVDGNDFLDGSLDAASQNIADMGLAPDADQVTRTAIRDTLVKIGADYLAEPTPNRRIRQTAEMRFIYETGHIAPLRRRIAQYRAGVIERLRVVPENAGSPCPDLDAELIYDALQSMQLANISEPEGLSRDEIERRLTRLVGWILGVE